MFIPGKTEEENEKHGDEINILGIEELIKIRLETDKRCRVSSQGFHHFKLFADKT